ncbi:MAG: hypothetical protein Fur0023_00160 [Bacteroidia bacterium]
MFLGMKSLKFSLVLFVWAAFSFVKAQSSPPEILSYQGIARDASGNILANQPIGIQLIIHQGSAGGTPVFTAAHSVITNSLGLFTLEIGSVNSLTFQSIDWSQGPYFLEVQIDPTGGTNYVSIGTQQLLSVPYALYAKKSALADSVPNFVPWKITGNSNIIPTIHFLGTTNNTPLILKTQNIERMSILGNGRILMGYTTVSAPTYGARLNVIGDPSDTLITRFSSNNPFYSIVQIEHPDTVYGVSALLLGNKKDTAAIVYDASKSRMGIASNTDVGVFAKDTLNFISGTNITTLSKYINMTASYNLDISSADSLSISSINKTTIGSVKRVSLFSLIDSINLYGRTRLFWSTTGSTFGNHAFVINFNNSSGNYSNALRVNHHINNSTTSFVSHGIYINNTAASGFSGNSVGIGSYSEFSGGFKRGMDILTKGAGSNIALFTHSEQGTISIDGYKDWSIYSDAGNVMFKDGHLVSSFNNINYQPTISTSGSGISAALNPSSTDTKGIITYNAAAISTGTITITFGTSYSKQPVVVFSYSGDATIKLSYVTTNAFELLIKNVGTTSTTGEIHYMVIE